MPIRLDQSGDPYRCCVPGCTKRSRGHLCARCYATYVDPDTHQLPAWLLALRREATRLAMKEHRGWHNYGVTVYDEGSGDMARAVDPSSQDWEDASATLLALTGA